MATSLPGGMEAGTWSARPERAQPRDAVHVADVRAACSGRSAAERGLRLVGAAVGNDDGVFHAARIIAAGRAAAKPQAAVSDPDASRASGTLSRYSRREPLNRMM